MISQLVFRSFVLGLTTALAGAGIVGAFAADGPKPITSEVSGVRDVRLSEDGILSLQLLTKEGQGIADVEVLVSYEDQKITSGKTKADGSVEFTGLRPGVHRISAGAGRETLRIWRIESRLSLTNEWFEVRSAFSLRIRIPLRTPTVTALVVR